MSPDAASPLTPPPPAKKCTRCGKHELVEGSFGRVACPQCDRFLFEKCRKCRSTRLECCC